MATDIHTSNRNAQPAPGYIRQEDRASTNLLWVILAFALLAIVGYGWYSSDTMEENDSSPLFNDTSDTSGVMRTETAPATSMTGTDSPVVVDTAPTVAE